MDSEADPWQAGLQDCLKRNEKKMEADRIPLLRGSYRCATWGSQPRRIYRPFRASASFPAGADCDDTEDSTYPLTYHTRENFEQLLQLTVTNFPIPPFHSANSPIREPIIHVAVCPA